MIMMSERQSYSIIFSLLIIGTIISLGTKYTNEGIIILVSAIFVFFYHLFCILNEPEPVYNNKGCIVK